MGIPSYTTTELARSRFRIDEQIAGKRRELAQLTDELAAVELEVADQNRLLGLFERRYLASVGALYVELDALAARIAEARSRRAQTDDAVAHRDARQARSRADRSAREYESFHAEPPATEAKGPITASLKKLYRQIAARIHPDKAESESARLARTRLMAELNEAYARGDEPRMREILQNWESSPETVTGNGETADLERLTRTIAQVRIKIREVAGELRRLKLSERYRLMLRVEEARIRGEDLLGELAEQLRAEIRLARQVLDGLQEQ